MVIQIEHGDYSSFNTLTEDQRVHILDNFKEFKDYEQLREYLCQNCDPVPVTSTNQVLFYLGMTEDVDQEEFIDMIRKLESCRE